MRQSRPPARLLLTFDIFYIPHVHLTRNRGATIQEESDETLSAAARRMEPQNLRRAGVKPAAVYRLSRSGVSKHWHPLPNQSEKRQKGKSTHADRVHWPLHSVLYANMWSFHWSASIKMCLIGNNDSARQTFLLELLVRYHFSECPAKAYAVLPFPTRASATICKDVLNRPLEFK